MVRGAGAPPVRIGAGAWARLPAWLARWAPTERYVLVADARVDALHGDRAAAALAATGAAVERLAFAPGERSKTRRTWARLSDALLARGVDRSTVLVALGGGVTTDLVGFVAATLLRGLRWVALPTSLLAMVDAALGGKTGVDVPAGKNLVGAFHPPAFVVADLEALDTLPPRHWREGLAETVKHAALADEAFFAWLEAEGPRLIGATGRVRARLVRRSAAIKQAIVRRDPTEAGVRMQLNFGHTLGHAWEAASGYRMPHGAAVARGLVSEARLGERLGWTAPGTAARLARLLERLGLPTAPPPYPPEAVLPYLRRDKKAHGATLRFALIAGIGRPLPSARPVPEAEVAALLAAACLAVTAS